MIPKPPPQDDYCAGLEKRLEEYETKIANMAVVSPGDLLFLAFAKKQYENEEFIRPHDMEEYFDDPTPKTKGELFKRRCWAKLNYFRRHTTESILVVLLFVVVSFMVWGVYATMQERSRKEHTLEVNTKIDNSLGFTGVVTDDSRRVRLTKFVADNNLKVNEEDLYSCIRMKQYDAIFCKDDKKLTSDEVLTLIPTKVENEENN
jgi:hypothetical protein